MSISLLFWVTFIITVLVGGFGVLDQSPLALRARQGTGVLFLIMLFLLGWGVFGFILQGGTPVVR